MESINKKIISILYLKSRIIDFTTEGQMVLIELGWHLGTGPIQSGFLKKDPVGRCKTTRSSSLSLSSNN